MKGAVRVLSPSSPDVLALSQGRADLFALRSARVPARRHSALFCIPSPCSWGESASGGEGQENQTLKPSAIIQILAVRHGARLLDIQPESS
jgi:hypothetical protein